MKKVANQNSSPAAEVPRGFNLAASGSNYVLYVLDLNRLAYFDCGELQWVDLLLSLRLHLRLPLIIQLISLHSPSRQ